MQKKYMKVKINAVLELVVYSDGEGFEDAVRDKIDEGDFEVHHHAVDDWKFLEDWEDQDLKDEYLMELKHEEIEENRRIAEGK